MINANFNRQSNPTLITKEIQDLYVRKNFEALSQYFGKENQLLGFEFNEVVFTETTANLKVAHQTGVIPRDIVVTQITGSGDVTFNLGLFDESTIDISASGPCRIRFFVGTYWNFLSRENAAETDTMIFSANKNASTQSSSTVIAPLTNAQVISGSFPGSNANLLQVRSTDKNIFVTGTSGYEVQLPKASEVTGEIISICKIDDTFTPVNIKTFLNSRDYIDTTGNTTTSLNSFKEKIQLFSNGTFYQIIERTFNQNSRFFTPTFDGLGTVTAIEMHWERVGPNMRVWGNFTTGVVTANQARIYLPAGILTADGDILPSITMVGLGFSDTNTNPGGKEISVLAQSRENFLRFSLVRTDSAVRALTSQLGNAVFFSSTKYAINAIVPIIDWKG